MLISVIGQYFLLKKCEKLLQCKSFSHVVNKNISVFDYKVIRAESKCRKDKDHALWYGAESPAEFRQVPVCCLSHWSGQQQHLLQRL